MIEEGAQVTDDFWRVYLTLSQPPLEAIMS